MKVEVYSQGNANITIDASYEGKDAIDMARQLAIDMSVFGKMIVKTNKFTEIYLYGKLVDPNIPALKIKISNRQA